MAIDYVYFLAFAVESVVFKYEHPYFQSGINIHEQSWLY
jgi:hypothetical protein